MISEVGERCVCVPIVSIADIVAARQKGRALAMAIGFKPNEVTLIVAAISELSNNIVKYAGNGEIQLRCHTSGMLTIVATDDGPGILDPSAILRVGLSTSGGLGLGLAGVRRIADAFDIVSSPGGTTVTVLKKKGSETTAP